MTKFRSYLLISITLLLVAGPWLGPSEISASSKKITDYGCRHGNCNGCCCSKSTNPEKTKPANEKEGCKCELTNLPAVPAIPFELNEHRLDAKSIKAEIGSYQMFQPWDNLNWCDIAPDKSPPFVSSRPTYILLSTLLI